MNKKRMQYIAIYLLDSDFPDVSRFGGFVYADHDKHSRFHDGWYLGTLVNDPNKTFVIILTPGQFSYNEAFAVYDIDDNSATVEAHNKFVRRQIVLLNLPYIDPSSLSTCGPPTECRPFLLYETDSAWNVFYTEHQDDTLPRIDDSLRMTRIWNNMTQDEKRVYEQKAAAVIKENQDIAIEIANNNHERLKKRLNLNLCVAGCIR